ncbi:MAG: Mbeg1-like protein [Hyphomicrobium sp.]
MAQQRREEQQQKEAAEAERKRKDEERKEEARQKQEAARQAELKRKADADAKKAEDKRQELARQDAKRKQDEASGRQKVSDILKKDLEKQRQADLQKTADQQRQELARFQAEFGKPKTAECHLMIIAYGRNDPKTQACLLKEQQNTRQPADVPVQPASPTSAQLEYLRRNATSLKPEQRTITVAPAPAGQPARYAQPSTFSSKTPDSKSASTSADPSCPDPKNIDKNRASEALPYALISNDSYNNEASLSVPAAGFVRTQNWETTMRDGGVSEHKIRDYKAAGFFAASYSNSTTGETVISYRGTDQLRDFTTNAEARFAPNLWHLQYEAASELARIVTRNANATGKVSNITLTGHSLGGGLASHAAEQQSISKVYTFNASRNALSSAGPRAGQVNIIVPGDNVGDPATSGSTIPNMIGTGCLPGQTFSTPTTGTVAGPVGGLFGDTSHNMDGIIGGLRGVIRQ